MTQDPCPICGGKLPDKKVWTMKDVLKLQKEYPDEYRKHRDEILEQMDKGLIQVD